LSVLVVDASVAAKWFFNEVHSPAAADVLRVANRLYAPDFLLLEMDSVFCKRVRHGDITAHQAAEARALLSNLPIEYHPFLSLSTRAYEIAVEYRCSVYDGLYVALAENLDAKVVTADRRFLESLAGGELSRRFIWVADL